MRQNDGRNFYQQNELLVNMLLYVFVGALFLHSGMFWLGFCIYAIYLVLFFKIERDKE